MEIVMNTTKTDRYNRAKKRVEELKGFYIHLAVYLCINAFILANIYVRSMGREESFWQWEHFFVLFGWGIGIAFHAAKTFGFSPIFGKNWEQRQIQKYMEEDRETARKFNI